MPTPRKHAKLIKAWADGAVIQFRQNPGRGDWFDCNQMMIVWGEDAEFRIKPQVVEDVTEELYVSRRNFMPAGNRVKPNLILTYNGNTGELKKAEVIG